MAELPGASASQILDAWAAHVAVIDQAGFIIYVNRAWTSFAQANGDPELTHTGVGVNYFAAMRGTDAAVTAVRQGIQAVLEGEMASFVADYPCHSPAEWRWFQLQVTPLELATGRLAVVAHSSLTRLRSAWNTEIQQRQSGQQRLELDALDRLSTGAPAVVTARSFGVVSLREGMPALFDELVARYAGVLDLALEQRTHKVEHPLAVELRAIAERLGFARAAPRDVVEIHAQALRTKLKLGQRVVQAYFEESRVLLLELMGYLVSHYRTYAVLAPVSHVNQPDEASVGESA